MSKDSFLRRDRRPSNLHHTEHEIKRELRAEMLLTYGNNDTYHKFIELYQQEIKSLRERREGVTHTYQDKLKKADITYMQAQFIEKFCDISKMPQFFEWLDVQKSSFEFPLDQFVALVKDNFPGKDVRVVRSTKIDLFKVMDFKQYQRKGKWFVGNINRIESSSQREIITTSAKEAELKKLTHALDKMIPLIEEHKPRIITVDSIHKTLKRHNIIEHLFENGVSCLRERLKGVYEYSNRLKHLENIALKELEDMLPSHINAGMVVSR